MRILCIRSNRNLDITIPEHFLSLSPRIHFRDGKFLFVDIASTAHLFGGERATLEKASLLCQSLGISASLVISDSPYGSQLLSFFSASKWIPPGEESSCIESLPLSALTEFEGLIPWEEPSQVNALAASLQNLGIQTFSELKKLPIEGMKSRWGEIGLLIWRRLRGQEIQLVSPLEPAEKLLATEVLDFPISLLSFLLFATEKPLRRLFQRLEARGDFVQSLQIKLLCEFSDKQHVFSFQASQANRNLDLWMKLIENQFKDLSLENPIKELSFEITPQPENISQMDFWEPRARDQDKVNQYLSLLQNAGVESGYFKILHSLLPEKSWELQAQPSAFCASSDSVDFLGFSSRIRPSYGKSLENSPKPSLVLREPQMVSESLKSSLQFFSAFPMERIESQWWESPIQRDYHYAQTKSGQNLFLFNDAQNPETWIQGYFD